MSSTHILLNITFLATHYVLDDYIGIAPVHFNCYVLFHMGKAYFINSLIDGYLDCLPFLVL